MRYNSRKKYGGRAEKRFDYNSLMRLFTERYVPEEDRDRIKAELELDYAVKRLESAVEYNMSTRFPIIRKSAKKLLFLMPIKPVNS